MKLLFDFFPIVLFFIFFKLSGIYVATTITIIASVLQVLICWIKDKKVENTYKITLAFVVVLGGATLLFHNPVFIKWKPTVVYWVSAIALIVSHIFSKKSGEHNLMKRLMGKNMMLPMLIWTRINFSWALFLFLMGSMNLYIAYYYDTDTWVNFKFFGGLGLTALFVFIQAIYLSRYAHFTFGDTKR
jgi:intracellular septation protein